MVKITNTLNRVGSIIYLLFYLIRSLILGIGSLYHIFTKLCFTGFLWQICLALKKTFSNILTQFSTYYLTLLLSFVHSYQCSDKFLHKTIIYCHMYSTTVFFNLKSFRVSIETIFCQEKIRLH